MLPIWKSNTKEAGEGIRRLGVSVLRVDREGHTAAEDCTVGSVEKYRTKALAQKAVEALLLKLNSETPQQRMAVVTFGAICDRYLAGRNAGTVFDLEVVPVEYQELPQAALG